MLLFVKQYKQDVLGVGEVALPGEGGALREGANQRTGKEAKDQSTSNKKGNVEHQVPCSTIPGPAPATANGTNESVKSEYVSE